jgi:hypothetical protein
VASRRAEIVEALLVDVLADVDALEYEIDAWHLGLARCSPRAVKRLSKRRFWFLLAAVVIVAGIVVIQVMLSASGVPQVHYPHHR